MMYKGEERCLDKTIYVFWTKPCNKNSVTGEQFDLMLADYSIFMEKLLISYQVIYILEAANSVTHFSHRDRETLNNIS